jgi:hypothetical protein
MDLTFLLKSELFFVVELRRHAESDRSIMHWYVEGREKVERESSPTACVRDTTARPGPRILVT